MSRYYILNESGQPVLTGNLDKWAAWFQNTETRRIAFDEIEGVQVSTVFLGLDHSFSDEGPPVLWETMVFGGPMDEHQERCAGSREQAEAMHADVVQRVKVAAYTPPRSG